MGYILVVTVDGISFYRFCFETDSIATGCAWFTCQWIIIIIKVSLSAYGAIAICATCMMSWHWLLLKLMWPYFGKSVLMSHFTTQIFITKMRNGNFQSTQQWLQCVVHAFNYQNIMWNSQKETHEHKWPDFGKSVLMSHWNIQNYTIYCGISKRVTEFSKCITYNPDYLMLDVTRS